jgi:hypothetical protein
VAIKSFNVSEEVYGRFSKYCKEYGISMSRQVELFMEAQLAEEPKARKEYLEKLERIRKGRFVRVDNFAKRYGLE